MSTSLLNCQRTAKVLSVGWDVIKDIHKEYLQKRAQIALSGALMAGIR